jgi:hypothetical protein
MKTLISISILSLSLFAGAAQAADASSRIFSDVAATAPRSATFEDLQAIAPRAGSFDELQAAAPRSGVFGELNQTAPRSDGVYGGLETQAP